MSRPSFIEAIESIKTLIRYIGDDPDRPGLKETPSRVLRAWTETWGRGYLNSNNDSLNKLLKSFPEDFLSLQQSSVDEMIIVQNISFYSHCEHHLTPFFGKVHIGYIPSTKQVIGLSKLARLVNVFARRLQVQERLTNQIADTLSAFVPTLGVGVIIQAQHMCMMSRGVEQACSIGITSALRGCLKGEGEARAEFLSLCRNGVK